MRLSDAKPADEVIVVMLEAGIFLCEHRYFDDAEVVFRGIIEFAPEAVEPRVGLATVALRREQFEEAERECAEALRLRPNSLYARVHHAEALLYLRRRAEAEAEFEEVIATDPESPEARTARAFLEAAPVIWPYDKWEAEAHMRAARATTEGTHEG